MENMNSFLLVIQVVLSISLIGLVLIQHGKGADAGSAFGSGASSTVFGARGSGNFLSKATAMIATLFFITCMALAYLASQQNRSAGAVDSVTSMQPETAQTLNIEGSDLPPAE